MKMTMSEAGKLGSLKSRASQELKYKERLEEYAQNPTRCSNCEQALPYNKRNNKYCGHSCAASVSNKGKCRNAVEGIRRNSKECKKCGAVTENKIFCSHKCSKAFLWDQKTQEIQTEGRVTGRWVAKRYISEFEGYKCRECGISEWNGQELSLVLDHINGNAEDWNLSNLRLLCPNCDSQTPTFKGRNLGNGRYFRRQRYKEGKSY